MNLPININDLLTARAVEWERLEFKAGWKPQKVLHTLCAFANDFHNLGGGYILIGVAEENGQPVLPPQGIPAGGLDAIQKEIVELGYKMVPYYHPIMAPCDIEGKHILVLWAMGGQARPYRAPVSLAKNEREFAYFIRKGSITVRASHQDEVELMSLAATVPYDDRMNQSATLDDLDLNLIRLPAHPDAVLEEISRETSEKSEVVREKWGEKWGEKIMARRLRIAQLMINNPRISTKELADALQLSTSGVENHLKAMRAAGCIRHVGPAKGGRWEVRDD